MFSSVFISVLLGITSVDAVTFLCPNDYSSDNLLYTELTVYILLGFSLFCYSFNISAYFLVPIDDSPVSLTVDPSPPISHQEVIIDLDAPPPVPPKRISELVSDISKYKDVTKQSQDEDDIKEVIPQVPDSTEQSKKGPIKFFHLYKE